MPDSNCHAFIDYVPFIGTIIGNKKIPAPVATRLMETGIMSLVAGAFAMYISVEVIKTELNHMTTQIEKVDEKVEQIRKDLYVPRNKHE